MFGKPKVIHKTKKVDRKKSRQIYDAMRQPQNADDIRLKNGEILTETIRFNRHIDMDISLYGTEYEDGEDNRPYTVAALYYDSFEVNRKVFDDPKFFGVWKLTYKNKTYSAELIPKDIDYE